MINLKQTCKIALLAVFFMHTAYTLSAADRYSVASGDWNLTSTWSSTSGGPPGASAPVEGDNVYIESNHTITVTADAACANIIITGNGSTLTVNSSVTLTVSGTIALNISENSNVSFALSGAGTIDCAYISVGQPSYNPAVQGAGDFYHTITSTISYIIVSADINVYSYQLDQGRKRFGSFNLEAGYMYVSGSIVASSEQGSKSTFSMETGAQSGTLLLDAAAPFNVPGRDVLELDGLSTLVNYNRDGDQLIYATEYNNLTLSGSGAKTITGATINGILSLEGTATTTGTTPGFGGNSTLQYKGSEAQTTGVELPAIFSGSGGIIIDNENGVTLSSSVTINSTLTLNSGALITGSTTLTFQNSDIPISRSNGTITTDTSTDIFFGTAGNTGGTAFTIPSGTFTTASTINNLTINRTNILTLGDQMISVTGVLLCNGPLNTSDNLTLLSDASGTALIDGTGTGQITGDVTMQRYLSVGFGYKYFSSPFQASTVGEFGDDMDLTYWFPTFYEYDESKTSSGWVDYSDPAGILEPIQGYAVNFGNVSDPNTVDVTGEVNNGPLSVTLYNNNNTYTQGLNLVGNPYPSPIDWDAVVGWTKTNIDNAIYFFEASTTDEYGGTYSSYVNGIPSNGSVTSIIPSMQGFFVHVSDGSYPVTGTLGMTNDIRLNNQSQAFYKSSSVIKAGNQSKPLIRIAVAFEDAADSKDPLVIYLHNMASGNFDSELDALKILNTDYQVPNLYATIPGNKKLSINSIPDDPESLRMIPLGIKINRSGTIKFMLLDEDDFFSDKDIFLHDNLTETRQVLGGESSYTITLESGEYHNRFSLEISNISTGIEEPTATDALFNVYSSNNLLKTNIYDISGGEGIFSVYNLTGQLVYREIIRQVGYYEFKAPAYRGIYIVNYRTAEKYSSRKIFVGN